MIKINIYNLNINKENMKAHLMIFLFTTFICLSKCSFLPNLMNKGIDALSNIKNKVYNIWKNFDKYIKIGKVVMDKKKNHFIFNEANFTSLDINSRKINILYNRQDKIYKKYRIKTFIFIVDNIEENNKSLFSESSTFLYYLKLLLNISVYRALGILISIKQKEIKMYPGRGLKRTFNSKDLKLIIDQITPYLKQKKYYEGMIELFNLIEKIAEIHRKKGLFFLFIIIITFIIGNCIIYIYNYCKNWFTDKNLEKISKFLKEQKSNENILIDNCVLCLEKFDKVKDKQNEENYIENIDSPTEELLKKDNIGVSKLKCGHQFHTICFKKWNKKYEECPLCKQKMDSQYNRDNFRFVLGVQNNIYNNKYNNFNFDDLFFNDNKDGHFLNNNNNNNNI